jgi:hypothetical protein
MTAPKFETIERYLDSGDAIAILHKRGILTATEKAQYQERARSAREAAYVNSYGSASGRDGRPARPRPRPPPR